MFSQKIFYFNYFLTKGGYFSFGTSSPDVKKWKIKPDKNLPELFQEGKFAMKKNVISDVLVKPLVILPMGLWCQLLICREPVEPAISQ